MKERLRRVLRMQIPWIYGLGMVAALGVLVYLFYPRVENFFIFYPQRTLDFHPQTLGLQYKDALFDTEEGKKLHGWYFPLRSEGPVILFCHGNAGNISHRLDNVARLLDKGLRVFLFDYRGYGKSEGSPSEQGIYEDGLAAYEYLVRKEAVSPGEIVLFGRSLGGAVAIEVALRKKVKALIIESTFTSVKDMARSLVLFRPFSRFVPNHYDNLGKVSELRVPVLVVHGDSDELVPFSMGERLYAAAHPPKFFYPVKGAGHNDTYEVGGSDYFQRLADFANETR